MKEERFLGLLRIQWFFEQFEKEETYWKESRADSLNDKKSREM